MSTRATPLWLKPSLKHRQSLTGLLFVLPGLIPLAIFVLYPVVSAILLSFTDYQFSDTVTFVGVQHYTDLWTSDQFRQSLLVTLEIALGTAVPSALLSLVIALLLNATVRFTGWYQSIFFLPVVLPTVVVAIIWSMLYQGNGLINVGLGIHIHWLTNGNYALLALIIMLIWTNIGYFAIFMLAGVRDIPQDYLEAARLDGANTFQVMWHITLPLLRPVLLFVVVIATTNALTLFAQPYLLTHGGPGDATRPLAELIYDTAFSYLNIGEAAAISLVLLLLAMGVAYIQFWVLRPKI
jgi:ABC-type sugar transport system permease subunit